MAVPTITHISPASGPAGGRSVVKITGTNFALPPTPPAFTHWAQTVQVLFDGVASLQVLPYGADLVVCVVPPYLGVFATGGASAQVDVVLKNLDPATGLPVSGEEATETDGWTYTRGTVSADDLLKWVSEHVGRHLQRQTIDNVILMAAHPDWDPDQATVKVEIQQVPALVLSPRIERYQFLATTTEEAGVATAADVTDTTTYPVTAGTGVLGVKVDREFDGHGVPQLVTFAGTETTAAQIAATIDAQLDGASAEDDGGHVKIMSDSTGGLSFVEVTANPAANPLLTFPTAEVQGTPEEAGRKVGGTWADIAFDVRGVEHKVEKIENLASMLKEFVDRTGSVPVPETVGDSGSDLVWLPIVMVSEPQFPDVPEDNAVVKEFLATFRVRGIVMDGGGIAALSEDFHSYVGVTDVDLDMEKSVL